VRRPPWVDLDDFPEAFFVLLCAEGMHTAAVAARTMTHDDEMEVEHADEDDDCRCHHSVHGEGWSSHHGAVAVKGAATRRLHVLRACS